MKLGTRVPQNLAQQQKLSIRRQRDLKMLEMNNQELESWTEKELEENSLLEFNDTYEIRAASHSQQGFDLLLNFMTSEQTLADVLREQIATCLHPLHKELAEFIVDSLDGNGYLQLKDEGIQRMLPQYNLGDIRGTINEIQTFEPAGVCARNPQECLLIQLYLKDIPYSQVAIMTVNFYLKEVSESKLPTITETLRIPLEDVLQAISLIRSLDPKPGARCATSSAYIDPNMQIVVEENEIHVQMFRKTYGLCLQAPIKDADTDTARYPSQQQKQAEALLSSIKKRNSTVERVMEIVAVVQQDFFLQHGQLKPLNMKDITAKLSLHESTISHAVSGKSVLFEQQIIPLKFFSPARVNENTGANEVHPRLRSLIDQEGKEKPCSDRKLCDLPKEDGLEISRRTITKYRDQLKIPVASKRKQF